MKREFLSTKDEGNDRFRVSTQVTHDDGTVEEGSHLFPHDALEWRAAEYGIDPSDTSTLLDIVLAEPYLTREDWAVGPQLYDENVTLEQVRAAHIARCAQVKLRHRMSTRGRAASQLQSVVDNHHMDPEALTVKRELVRVAREVHHTARAVQRTPVDRVQALRHELHSIKQRDSR